VRRDDDLALQAAAREAASVAAVESVVAEMLLHSALERAALEDD